MNPSLKLRSKKEGTFEIDKIHLTSLLVFEARITIIILKIGLEV